MASKSKIEKAFENGMAVDRISAATFKYERRPIIGIFGFAAGVALTLFGIFPLVKLLEGGEAYNAAIGIIMIVVGFICVALASKLDGDWEKAREKALDDHYEKTKANLLDLSINGRK